MSQDDLIPSDMVNTLGKIRRMDLQGQSSTPSACDITEASKGRVVGYKSPGGGEGGAACCDTDKAILDALQGNNRLLESINNFLSLNYEPPTESWFETKVTTTSVTPDQLDTQTNPIMSQDQTTLDANPGYNFLNVNSQLRGRNATKLYIVNDGPGNMYLRTSKDGSSFSPEFQMILGEKRVVWDVYEVRYRSSTNVPVPLPPSIIVGPGNTMRVSEREIYTPYVTIVSNTATNSTNNIISGSSGFGNFIAKSQNIALPLTSTQLVSTVIPNGVSVVVTNNKNNTVDMFVSRTDAMIAADRITLGVGDSISLGITNTNLIFVAFSLPGQIVDILAEQN